MKKDTDRDDECTNAINDEVIWNQDYAIERDELLFKSLMREDIQLAADEGYKLGYVIGHTDGIQCGKRHVLNGLLKIKYGFENLSWLQKLDYLQLDQVFRELFICKSFHKLKSKIESYQIQA